MSVAEHLQRLGGFADHRTLVRLTSRRRVAQALADGDIVQLARGRYALPTADVAVGRAHGLGGVVSHLSAAAWWHWELKAQPALPQVTVPKHRRIRGARHGVHFIDLHPDDVYDEVVTSRERTIVDCLRTLPFDEGLTVVDSALRHLDVTKSGLAVIARDVRGPGSPAVRTAIRHASGEAANPFESVLRAIAIQAGLSVKPQAVVREGAVSVRPDLVDEGRRLVLEADSFAWHGSRSALKRDCRRYNWLVRQGWRVLRFAYEDVMFDQADVLDLLIDVGRTQGWTEVRRRDRRTA